MRKKIYWKHKKKKKLLFKKSKKDFDFLIFFKVMPNKIHKK